LFGKHLDNRFACMAHPTAGNEDVMKTHRFDPHGYGDTRGVVGYQNLFYPFKQGSHQVHLYRIGIHVHKG